ncbi:MAG: aminotransferase class I/II-fold pyridoxal phosphate-dependent enzyme [Rickettsiales bacterium]|nr:aminotransferase class I/II-fold pyridoxal phosphate-dependent enzyme [Rickettsiales bacterium]
MDFPFKYEEFPRIKRLPPYVFAAVNEAKAAARKRGEDIIDFGLGNPDSPAPKHVIEKMKQTIIKPDVHGYSVSQGILGLRKAVAGYYERRFNVSLDVDSEIAVSQGSKEGLYHLAIAISKPGDVVVVPNPSYPIHTFGFVLAEASVYSINRDFQTPVKEDLIPKFKNAFENIKPKPLAVIVNFPSNPTAETVGLDFYEEMVDLCRFYGVILISDLAYCETYFDGVPPPSVMQVKKAKEVAVEFTTLSKTYSMAGWRVGFCVGNKEILKAHKRVKSYLDYGSFTPIQVSATQALNGPQDCVEEFRNKYKRRRDIMVPALRRAGWNVANPNASMFIWAEIPEKFKAMGSVEFAKLLLKEAKVAVSPGAGFGSNGDGFVRISLIENEHRSRQACHNIKAFFKKEGLC